MGLTDLPGTAVEEIGKTVREYRPEVRQFGEFVGSLIGKPIEHGLGLFGDAFLMARIELATRFAGRAGRLMTERGLIKPTRAIPLPVLVPLIEAASLEEDDDLSELWAQMLVNAGDADSGVEVSRSFVGLLRGLGPLDVRILARLVEASEDERGEGGLVIAAGLPERYVGEAEFKEKKPEIPPNVEAALWNLVGQGCIVPGATWDGPSVTWVKATRLGEALVAACRPPHQA